MLEFMRSYKFVMFSSSVDKNRLMSKKIEEGLTPEEESILV